MARMVCPWWCGYFLLSPWRRLVVKPRAMLVHYVTPGMTVLEPGCGMGFFTLELARLVGPSGRVVAVDLQPRMLAGLERRSRRAGLDSRIEARRVAADSLGIADLAGQVDFGLAFYMVHEVPDAARFFAEMRAALKVGGKLLFVEPKHHVGEAAFSASLRLAEAAGFRSVASPATGRGRSAELEAV